MVVSNTYYNPTTKKTETLWQVPDKPVEAGLGFAPKAGGFEGIDGPRVQNVVYQDSLTDQMYPGMIYREDFTKKYDPQRTFLSGSRIPGNVEDYYSGNPRAAVLAGLKAREESELARALEDKFRTSDSESVTTPGPAKKAWNPYIWGGMVEASRYEKDIKTKMAGEEAVYDKAYGDTLTAQEMARTGRGVIKAGSAAQQALVGGTGAGVAKAGKFKNLTELGSLLPASWMARKLDPSKIASQLSGIADREGEVTGKFKSEYMPAAQAQAQEVGYTFGRSKFTAPTVKKTGLGKYAAISNLIPPASSPQNYFSGGSSRFDEKTGKYL